ncbi:ATP-binding protein [Schlegelella sp. S2-27]|uniref:histidine kinase n=1 Tax=Caldimonas mangrovi TaxID=2944811 RepID=A0ABT0YUT7_9BURK|nr:ATP-binding protein [Caldimonas mangrovi]MCM5681856.1 ATP-binding protein [Caldimonas mangrovi]
MKLRTRLVVLIVVTLAPAVGIQVVDRIERISQQEDAALREVQSRASLVAGQLEQLTSGYRELLMAVNASGAVQPSDVERCNAYIDDLAQQFGGVPTFMLGAADLKGNVYCVGQPFLRGRPINIADRTYFKQALETGDFVVGEHAFARVPGDAVLHYAYPMLDPDTQQPEGVLIVSLLLRRVADILAENPLPAGARLTVTDRRGTALIELPERDGVSKPVNPQLRSLLLERHQPGAASWVDSSGEERIVGYVPLDAGPRGLSVALSMPRDAVMAPLRRAALRDAVTLLAAVGLGLFLAWFVARSKLYRPLSMLTATAGRWSEGDLTARTGLAKVEDVEFSLLGTTLDSMAENLHTRQQELAAANEEMRRSRDEALKASLSKTHFLAAASHDLRQPLQAMNLNIALLAARHGQGPDATTIERLRRSVGSLAELLNALLDVSQLDAGLIKPNVSDFGLESLLQSIADEFSAAARQKGVHLSVEPFHAAVRSDPVLLGRMARNLVSNAVKYTEAGGWVKVSCRDCVDHIDIVVADSGAGIPADKQEEVFEEFRQLGNPQRNPSLGLGLGLAIVKRMSMLLQHPVQLYSEPGVGTTVSMSVPRAHRLERRAPDLDSLHFEGRALLVEDDLLVAESTADLLRSWGLHVSVVGSAEEAFQLIDDTLQTWNAVLADYRLPTHSGLDVLERVRQSQPQALTLVLTGDAADKRLADARDKGLQVLEKPVRLERLAQALTPLARDPSRGTTTRNLRLAG